MKSNRRKKILSLLLALAMVFTMMPTVALGASTDTYTKVTSADELTSGEYVMVVDTGVAPTVLNGTWIEATTVTPEGDTVVGPVWRLTFDTTAKTVTMQGANDKFVAPSGGNNNGIKEGNYSWAYTFENGKAVFKGVGADTVILASNKGSEGKFRAYKDSTVSGNQAGYPSNFTLYKKTSGGGEVTVVAAPMATPAAGAVIAGTEITLTTATAGASIYYTLDGSEPTTDSALYSDTNKPVIEKDCVLKAIAVLEGKTSTVQTLSYTLKNFHYGSLVTELKDGDEVVMYLPENSVAVSTTASGSKLAAAPGTVENGKLSSGAENIVFKVEKDGENYKFTADGKYLTAGATGNALTLEATANDYSLWTLEAAEGDGNYFIKNVNAQYNGGKQYIEYYNGFTTYGKGATANPVIYTFRFYAATDSIKDGDKVVIYAPAYNKALSTKKVATYYNAGVDVTIADGKMSGYEETEIWTVIDNGDGTFSFENGGRTIGLADTNSSMSQDAVNDKWELTELGGGLFNVRNTVRKNYMEWYASKDNWSTYNSSSAATDDQFQIAFWPVANDGTDTPGEPSDVEGLEIVATPKTGSSVKAGQLVTLKGADGVEIYFTMSTDGQAPADPDVTNAAQKYADPIEIAATPEEGKPVIIKAVAYKPAEGDNEAQTGEVYTLVYKAPVDIDNYGLYFGQLHAHTNISDGTGTVEEAFKHASNVSNLDYLAVTDHSNWFEGQSGLPAAGTTHLGDANAQQVNSAWKHGKDAAKNITTEKFVGLYGYEMTWSGGNPGHINTFNSLGFENRNVAPYKKGDNYEVLQAYFDALNANPETISQFNHPGDTFGDFMDFALYSPVTDNQVTILEVGNGEGPIGGSGYFPSYSYYTRALDKGWHVAPTNNQDNHKGNWGDSNTARSVVLADSLQETSIYDAMKNYRVYATEDNDLSILYTLNGNAMGSILPAQETIGIEAKIADPTDTAGNTKVEVVVNGGKVIAEQTFAGGSATVNFENLSTTYGYYYLRVTQADKNIAVTAPVWVGESVNAGIDSTTADLEMPIKGDTLNISSQIFNNLAEEMTVTSLTYTVAGQAEPFHVADVAEIGTNGVVAKRSADKYSFEYLAENAGGFNINVEMKALIAGEEYTFTDVLKLTVTDSSVATKVLVDGSHYNDYVNGYYAGSMGTLTTLAAAQNIQVKVAKPGTTMDEFRAMLKETSMFVISSPAKKTLDGGIVPTVFEDEFVEIVKEFVAGGGTIIVCGIADYQDSGAVPYTTYEQANKLLKGIGSTMGMNDDELLDLDDNGGQSYRLYFDDFNYGSTDAAVQKLLDGVKESGLTYSSYSGCSVSVGKGQAVVMGHDTTFSINSKNPAQGHNKPVGSTTAYDPATAVVDKGDVVAMATEQVGKGRVFVTGTVFCSSYELSLEETPSYANTIITKNILDMIQKQPVISTIEEARQGKFGDVFTVIGTVANGTAESGNAFFDTIYIQDENGNGINVFPINDNTIKRGDRVMVTGSVSEYIGDRQLSAITVTVLDGTEDVVITEATTKEANDYDANFGKLVKVEGYVKSVTVASGLVESVIIEDESGESCRLFIDGYIGYSDESSKALESFIEEGAYISGIGFVSHDAEGNRLRVRDRSEILPETAPVHVHEHTLTAVTPEDYAKMVEDGLIEGYNTCTAPQLLKTIYICADEDCMRIFTDAEGLVDITDMTDEEAMEAGYFGAPVGHKFEDGKCTVCGATDPEYKPGTDTPETETPKTGDSNVVILWGALLAISGIATQIARTLRRKEEN